MCLIKKIFIEFKIKKARLERNLILKRYQGRFFNSNPNKFRKEKEYVETVELILNNLSKEEKEILVNTFIHCKKWHELSYSYSTYYRKLKRAEQNFMLFFGGKTSADSLES
ncbi:MAG: hypothetical protein HUJ42_03575 [Malacoplasma sp.]|nr:hypothetical protein [Malacoplasma sp.]